MASSILSLVGPDLDPADVKENGVPSLVPVIPNTSSANTQATLRRSYALQTVNGVTNVKIATGLPAQDLPGSWVLTMTPTSGASGKVAIQRFATAGYNSAASELTVELDAGVATAGVILSIDLAHTATR